MEGCPWPLRPTPVWNGHLFHRKSAVDIPSFAVLCSEGKRYLMLHLGKLSRYRSVPCIDTVG
jgi:hypothetical protein